MTKFGPLNKDVNNNETMAQSSKIIFEIKVKGLGYKAIEPKLHTWRDLISSILHFHVHMEDAFDWWITTLNKVI